MFYVKYDIINIISMEEYIYMKVVFFILLAVFFYVAGRYKNFSSLILGAILLFIKVTIVTVIIAVIAIIMGDDMGED